MGVKVTENRRPKPPRLARSVLKLLGEYNTKYSLLDDFDDVYQSLHEDKGHFLAVVWYWFHCLGILPQYFKYMITWRTVMLKNTIKLTFRNLHRSKITTVINITGLSVGMAGAILILLWVQHELSYEKFHKNANSLYLVAWERMANNRHYSSTPAPLADRMKQDFPEFENKVRLSLSNRSIVKHKDKVFVEEQIAVADPSLFRMFSFPLIQGDELKVLTEPNTVVLTETTAKKYFGEQNPLGKILEFDRRPLEVCGIVSDLPGNTEITFDFITRFRDLSIFQGDPHFQWNHFSFYTFVQLKQGMDILEINQKLSAAMERYRPWDPYKRYFYLYPLTRLHLHNIGGGGLIKYVFLFSLAALFILLISCINFINLATARSAGRAREVGMRKVLGSGRNQLFKQFFSESIVLVLLSFSLALVIVQAVLPSFNALVQKSLMFQLGDPSFLLSLFAVLLITGLISGSYPAVYLSSFQPVRIFRSPLGPRGKGRFRQALVVIQFAVSVLLIFCTFIVSKQIRFMKHADLGFEIENLLSIPITESMSDHAETIRNALIRLPSVIHIAAAGPTNQGGSLRWEGMDPELSYLENEVNFRMVDYDYFATLGAEVVAGRNFSRQYGSDIKAGYIINEEAVKLWHLDFPVGKSLNLCGRSGQIIGVVKNIHMGYKNSLRAEVYYLSKMTEWDRFTSLNARIQPGGIPETMDKAKGIWEEYNGNRPFEYSFFDQEIDRKYNQEERVSHIFVYFAALSIFISCLGLFGLAMFMVEQKTKEIGIRKVLGASFSKIVMIINREFLRCVLLASIIAWPLGWIVMRSWLNAYPYRTEIGWSFFVLSSLFAVVITVLTVSIQAGKAALANPSDALRYE
jgi:ABC-type antimicrobial peptide transport system permease subunit